MKVQVLIGSPMCCADATAKIRGVRANGAFNAAPNPGSPIWQLTEQAYQTQHPEELIFCPFCGHRLPTDIADAEGVYTAMPKEERHE
jgi:hypothetical protein